MPKLILSMDGLVLKDILLDKERVTIGRKPNNDIQIDNLAISGQHAVITTLGADAFLEDLNSTNGTYVNGQSVRKHALQPNDAIELGKYKLKYLVDVDQGGTINPEQGGRDALDPVATNFTGSATTSRHGPPAASTQILPPELRVPTETTVPGAANYVGVIKVLSGPHAGKELVLSKSLTTLGKPGFQVAVITRRAQGYYMTHVDGDTFPLVNNQPIDANARRLEAHDQIFLAGVQMQFLIRE